MSDDTLTTSFRVLRAPDHILQDLLGRRRDMRQDVPTGVTDAGPSSGASDPLALARRLLVEARAGVADPSCRAALASLDPSELAAALRDEPSRTAFWLNVYNASVRARLLADPAAFRPRWRFFTTSAITVAGRRLSPNAIEHGLLRRSALSLGLGYLRNPAPSAFERGLRVARVDARMHFALNCGARSCPPLAVWEPASLDDDLERATRAYLIAETRRRSAGRTLLVPRLLLWYRGDFGGSAGVRRLLERHAVIAAGEQVRIRYGRYDWTLDLDEPTA